MCDASQLISLAKISYEYNYFFFHLQLLTSRLIGWLFGLIEDHMSVQERRDWKTDTEEPGYDTILFFVRAICFLTG